jgi:tripartite-type tricarboxylate transporter receptor subunit TctC
MQMTSRISFGRACSVLALATFMPGGVMQFGSAAHAQDYPSKRISMVVGYEAGGFADSVARIVADHLGNVLGQSVIVTNRGGAASNIAARAVTGAPADGYTILASTTSLAANASL